MLGKPGNPGTEPKTCEKGPKLGSEYLPTSKTSHCVRTACMAFPSSSLNLLTSTCIKEMWRVVADLENGHTKLHHSSMHKFVPPPPLAQARPRSQKSGQNGGSTPDPCLDKAVHARDTCDSQTGNNIVSHG